MQMIVARSRSKRIPKLRVALSMRRASNQVRPSVYKDTYIAHCRVCCIWAHCSPPWPCDRCGDQPGEARLRSSDAPLLTGTGRASGQALESRIATDRDDGSETDFDNPGDELKDVPEAGPSSQSALDQPGTRHHDTCCPPNARPNSESDVSPIAGQVGHADQVSDSASK